MGNVRSELAGLLADGRKKARYGAAFLRRGLVHTNLQLHYACNFRCRICDFHKPGFHNTRQLSLDEVRVISRKLAEIGPQIVSIGGGEPMLHPDIEGIVRTLGRDHFPVMICNGWYVDAEAARALWDAGMYEISVSVDYADPRKHDDQRGRAGAFERAIGALRVLHQTRTRSWQRVHMITVVMDDNLDDIEALVLLCRELGITYLVTLYSDGRGRLPRRAARPDLSGQLLDLARRYPELVQVSGYMARFTEAVRDGGVGPCHAGKNLCNIDSQGDVSLCIDRLDTRVGNLLTDDARQIERRLAEAWRSNECAACWTSCRGTIETLMYGGPGGRLRNLGDYYRMTRTVPLTSASDRAFP